MTKRNRRRGNRAYIVVRQGFEGAFTGTSSEEAAEQRLRDIPLHNALDILGRISSLLLFRSPDDKVFIETVAKGVLGYKAERFLEAVSRQQTAMHAQGSSDTVAAFDNSVVLVCAKLVLSRLRPTLPPESFPITRLGEALLMIGDITGKWTFSSESTDAQDPTVLADWAVFSVVNAFSQSHRDRLHLMARSFELFLDPPALLRKGIPQFDLRSIIQEITGLSVDEYWIVAFSLLAHSASITPTTAAKTPVVFNIDTYFSSNFSLSAADSRRFFQLFGRELDVLREELLQYSHEQLWSPYFPLPFAATPFVLVNGHAYCPCATLLLERMTDGLYYLLLDATLPGDRPKLQAFLGAVFEEYVNRVLARMFPQTRRGVRLITGAMLDEALGDSRDQRCDAIVLQDDRALLIETKASRLSLGRRAGLDRSGALLKLKEIYVDAVKQTHATIHAIESGRLAGLGVPPGTIKHYLPVVVTLEDIAMRRPLYLTLNASLGSAPEGTAPWQALQVAELEAAEGGLEQGLDLLDLLFAKALHPFYRSETLTNYADAAYAPFMSFRSHHLLSVYERLAKKAAAFFAEHRRSTVASPPLSGMDAQG